MEETKRERDNAGSGRDGAGKTLIISGGAIEPEFAKSVIQEHDFKYIIGADAGLRFLHQENIEPTHIVGDFDSLEQEILEYYTRDPKVTIRIFNPIKDQTDTEIALRLGIELNSSEIWLLGGNGARVDHTISNIQSLMIPLKAGIPCVMADAHNQIRLLREGTRIRKDEMFGTYLSFFPLGSAVRGLTITGVKYPLTNFDMKPDDSLGVSNEILDEEAVITFRRGVLIMIMSKDGEQF